MVRVIYLFLIYSMATSCSPKEYTIQMEMDLDSIQFDLYHYASGKKIYTAHYDQIADKKINIPLPQEDMYTISIHWNRTYVPHQLFKRRNGKVEFDIDNKYYLIKNIYINPKQSSTMRLSITPNYTKEKLETASYYEDCLKVSLESNDFKLSEQYNQIYVDADSLKAQSMAILKSRLIKSVERDDLQGAQQINMILTSDSLERLREWYIKKHMQASIVQNNQNAVTTFYLFKELLENRNFAEYQNEFALLKNGATKSPYYKMIKKQYHSSHYPAQ